MKRKKILLGLPVVAVFTVVSFAVAADEKSSGLVPSAEYELPDYTNTKFPAITSCDVKSGDTSDADSNGLTTGNVYIDSTTSTAKTLSEAFSKRKDYDGGDEDGIEDGVRMDKNCGEPTRMNTDGAVAEKLSCTKFQDANFINDLIEENMRARKILACQRGVLAAINGELSCFKKQITEAQAYMNELINNQGGLASMLNTGTAQMTAIDQEVADREAQLKELTRRLEDSKTGMGAAKEALDKLSSEIPTQQTAIENTIQKIREDQQRYDTLVRQATLGRTLECLKRPAPGYICVKQGSSSSKYPTGNVSPLDYMKCIYAQNANRVVGGSVVKNEKLENSRIAQVDALVKSLSAPDFTDIPAFGNTEANQKAFSEAMRSYQINSPEQLIAAFSSLTGAADKAVGKSVSGQFQRDVMACYNQAKAQIDRDRQDSNTNIGVGRTVLAQAAKTKSAEFASQMRKLKSMYEHAVKSATGKSVQLNTARCERETLENQSKCLDAIGSLVDAVLTGDSNAAMAKLNGPAAGLTSGQLPISGFISSLDAPSDKTRKITPQSPPRTITNINCKGLTDCVAKYENLKVELANVVEERKQRKESMKSEINNAIVQTAQQIASGKNAEGLQTSSMSLNQVAKSLTDRKEQLIAAMKHLKVGGSLELDPEKIGDTDIDEKTGLYKANSLRNIVLSAIDPKMLANDERGFAEASRDIQKRDNDLEEKQQKLDTFVDKAEARMASCASDAKKVACEKVKDFQNSFCKEKSDAASKLIDDFLMMAKTAAASGNKDQADLYSKMAMDAQKLNIAPAGVGETDGTSASPGSELNCGTAPEQYAKYCGLGDAVTDVSYKDFNTQTGTNQRGGAYRSRTIR